MRCNTRKARFTRDPHLGKVMLYQLSHFRSEMLRTLPTRSSRYDKGDASRPVRTRCTSQTP